MKHRSKMNDSVCLYVIPQRTNTQVKFSTVKLNVVVT